MKQLTCNNFLLKNVVLQANTSSHTVRILSLKGNLTYHGLGEVAFIHTRQISSIFSSKKTSKEKMGDNNEGTERRIGKRERTPINDKSLGKVSSPY
jgi:hypothetical protein